MTTRQGARPMSTWEAYEAELARLRQDFADNVRRLRAQSGPGYSQQNLADAADLHRTEIGKIEGAERDPRMSTLLILANALGLTVDDLVRGLPVPKERRPSPGTRRAGD
jgi:transcriptional regulator with XRE-family HTH domain